MAAFHVLFRNNNGRRNHYYHFFYGVFLPLSEFISNLTRNEPWTIVMTSCGEMDKHLTSHPLIPPGCRLELIPECQMQSDASRIRGIDEAPKAMASFFVRTKESVREMLLREFGVCEFAGKKTLVVKRIKRPQGVHHNEASGAKRRYIVNHSRIVKLLREDGHDVEVVTLERMTMAQQACRFASASTIIAQHGAGLSNLYFCRPGSKVVELGANGRRHYLDLANLLDLEYHHVKTNPRSEGPCFANAQAVLAAARCFD